MTRAMPMSEAAWQRRITDYCDHLNLKWHHEVDSRKSKSGFPDLVIVGKTTLFVELKRDNGRVSHEQALWLGKLADAGSEVHVWKPSDWPYVARRLRVLAGRP